MASYKSYELLAHYNKYGANNSTIVDEILAHGDLDFRIPSSVPYKGTSLKGYTALHVALKREDHEVFQVLLKSGANFTVKTAGGSTVLHQAVKTIRHMKKYRKFIDSVLSAHVNLNVPENPHDSDGISHLHVACMMNRSDAVEMFLNSGVPVDEAVNSDSANFSGYAALHFAAEYCCLQTAKILLERGAAVNVGDARGRTPLHLLIARRIRIFDWKNMGKRAPWEKFKAELEANAQIIVLFLEKWGAQSDDVLDNSNLSYFHVACTFEDTSRVAKLMEKSVDLEHRVAADSPLWPGYTALHFAARCNPETVVLLLENGADFLAKDASGVTPLDLCLQRYEVEYLHRFVSLEPALQNVTFSDGTTRLIDAILAMKNERTLSDFIAKIADINVTLEPCVWSGFTLLHLATMLPERNNPISALREFIHADRNDELENSYNCSEETEAIYLDRIKMCLNRGTDINTRDAHNSTPLHLAFRLQKESAVDCLLESHELLENAVDRDNLSHLYIACAADNESVVESLLSKSTDHVNLAVTSEFKCFTTFVVHEKSVGISAGATPLHVAVSTGNERIVQLLMNHEADRYARDANGLTPIHCAFVQGLREKENCQIYEELASVLLSCDDLMECQTGFGLTHLHVASYANNVTAIEKLLTSGANIEATISAENLLDEELRSLKVVNGFTPQHLALKYDCREALVALVRSGANFLAVPPNIGFALHEKHSDFLAATLMNELASQNAIKQRLGLTDLHAACAALDVDRTRELLKRGANPNAQINGDSPIWAGNTPLHFLVIRRDEYPWDSIFSIMALLWKYKADVTVENSNNETSLLNAMFLAHEDQEFFQFPMSLINNHRNFKVNPVNNEGWSHFHVACFWNKSDIVQKFIKCGVNVNQPIDYFSRMYAGFSPIHLTAYLKGNETLEVLLKCGADIQVRNISGRTPFHEAVNFKYYKDYNVPFPVHLGQTPVMSLLKAGADQTSLTPLRESSFEILLKSHRLTSNYVGIDYDRGSINLYNPLTGEGYIAMAISHETTVDKLPENLLYQTLIKAPKRHVPDEHGRTPIHNVVSIRSTSTTMEVYVNVIEQLTDLNFDIDLQDSKGRTALHWATKFRNGAAIDALLTLGSDINITDINNETPLSYIWEFCEKNYFVGYSARDVYNTVVPKYETVEATSY